MKFRRQLERENAELFDHIEKMNEHMRGLEEEVDRLQHQVYALQMDNDIYESALHAIATRKTAEVVNRIMAYETETAPYEYPTYSNDAELFADIYAKDK